MNGYVRNISSGWIHIFKQGLGPNATLSLDKLYEIYGPKNNLQEGDEFVDWLKKVKLNNRADCKLVYEAAYSKKNKLEDKPKEEVSKEEEVVSKQEEVAPTKPVPNDEVTAITGLSAIKAKDKLTKITNLPLLKDAFRQARQMPNKDTLCRLIDKRIRELEQYY